MRCMRIVAGAVLSAAMLSVPAPASAAPDVCTWGGTPLEPTADATISPGLSNAHPASDYLHGHVTGPLAGAGARCTGTMEWDGVLHPGSTCNFFILSGTVSGVPGVQWMFEVSGAYGRSMLLSPEGRLVGSWGSNALSRELLETGRACGTDEGLTNARISFTMELFA